eukprot:3343671-Alexandrium_andersonii.AAC.1
MFNSRWRYSVRSVRFAIRFDLYSVHASPSTSLGLNCANVGDPQASLPDAAGAALRAVSLGSGSAEWESPPFARLEPRR